MGNLDVRHAHAIISTSLSSDSSPLATEPKKRTLNTPCYLENRDRLHYRMVIAYLSINLQLCKLRVNQIPLRRIQKF
jgi:hypothetical protein